jgi:hypothetical protein
MKILVSKKVKLATTEDAIYLEDMQYHPQKRITCRGTIHHSGANMQLKRCLLRMLQMALAKL